MNAKQCEKCRERTATVYLTFIGPSAEPDKHNFCESCYEIFREERAKVPIQAANLQPVDFSQLAAISNKAFVTLPAYKI